MNGGISEFTGITSPYEPPTIPEIKVETDRYSLDECVDQIIERLIEKKIITKVE